MSQKKFNDPKTTLGQAGRQKIYIIKHFIYMYQRRKTSPLNQNLLWPILEGDIKLLISSMPLIYSYAPNNYVVCTRFLE